MKHLESLYSPQEFKETWNNIKQSRRLKQTINYTQSINYTHFSIILVFPQHHQGLEQPTPECR